MVEQKRKPPLPVRLPASQHDELTNRARWIARVKGIKPNALIAGYVIKGINRDWKHLDGEQVRKSNN